jgi:hypothetical protein
MRTSSAVVLIVLLVCSALAACAPSTHRPDPHSLAPTTINQQIVGRTTLAMPIPIPGHATVLIPFAIESEKDWFQTKDPYAVGGYAPASVAASRYESADAQSIALCYNRGGSVRWHNAIIRDLKSGDEWSILDKRGVISSWQMCGPQPRLPIESFKTTVLVFLATIDDTNHDGVLNDLDARVAIDTDADGRHPRIVSPPNAQVWSTVYDAENSRIYLMVVADTNGDGKYDFNDAPVPYVCDPSAPGAATPAVSKDTLRKMKALLQ